MICAKVSAEAREMLLGHSIGLSKAYYKPGEEEILQEYLKAIDLLTINEENRLRREIKSQKEKDDELHGIKLQQVTMQNIYTYIRIKKMNE